MRRAGLLAVATTAAAAILAPAAAQAHLVATGMGPLYDGITHFALSPEDSLPVIGLGFYAGLRGAGASRRQLAILTLAWLVGSAACLAGFAVPPVVLAGLTAALYLAIGALLAANVDFGPVLRGTLAAVLGLVRGAADFAGVSASPSHAMTVLGVAASVFAVFALAVSITLPLRRAWMIVAARVGGSWLAALGLLFAGWIIRFGTAAAP
jgi:hypothetical protein